MVVLGGSVGNSEMIFLSYTGEYIRLDAVGNREISGSVYTKHPECVVKNAFFNDKDSLCFRKCSTV